MKRALAVLLLVCATQARSQVRLEGRVEAVRARESRAEAGLGLHVPLGAYVRSGVNAAFDVVSDGRGLLCSRAEVQVRFLLDPLAEQRWGLSFAGGFGVRERAYLMAAADLEGPVMNGLRPAFQLALGEGARIVFVLRGARRSRR